MRVRSTATQESDSIWLEELPIIEAGNVADDEEEWETQLATSYSHLLRE